MQKEQPDLVADFYAQDIDFKSLIKAKKSTRKQVTSYSLSPYNGTFGKTQKRHLLNRVLIGNAKRHMDDLTNLSLGEAIEMIFTPEEMGEPINNYYHKMNASEYAEHYTTEDVPPLAPFISRPYTRNRPGSEEQFGWERQSAIRSWYHYGIYNQNTSINWKLFLFLHNLVPTRSFDLFGHKSAFNYMKLLFDSCFGSYKQFIYDISIDSSMLNYLNLASSKKETPDENFAREVQELFTVGKRPFAQFSEGDVREIARALVGWSFDYERFVYEEGHEDTHYFHAWNHDTGDKFFSEFYDNTIIRGRSGQEGEEELAEVIDMLFQTDESCIYIARRLYQFFVSPELSEQIETQIILPLSETFRSSNFSLVETLKVLLSSEHFFDEGNYNSLIMAPYEYAYKVFKEMNVLDGYLFVWTGSVGYNSIVRPNYFPNEIKDRYVQRYNAFQSLGWILNQMGMQINDPPSVSGWPAYYQEPVYDLFWINSSTMKSRKRFAESVFRWGIWLDYEIEGHGANLRFNSLDFISSFQNPSNIDQFLEELNDRFLGMEIPEVTKLRLRNALLNGVSEAHWTEEVNNVLNSGETNPESFVRWRLENTLYLYTMLGEFHLH